MSENPVPTTHFLKKTKTNKTKHHILEIVATNDPLISENF